MWTYGNQNSVKALWMFFPCCGGANSQDQAKEALCSWSMCCQMQTNYNEWNIQENSCSSVLALCVMVLFLHCTIEAIQSLPLYMYYLPSWPWHQEKWSKCSEHTILMKSLQWILVYTICPHYLYGPRNVYCQKNVHNQSRDEITLVPEVDVTHTNNLSLSPSLAQLMLQCIATNSILLDIRLQVEWLVLKWCVSIMQLVRIVYIGVVITIPSVCC